MSEAKADTLERGQIYFFFRPKIEEEEPRGRSDVQRLYAVLSPEGDPHYRLAIIGRKRLPEPGGHGRNWGFVERVSNSPAAIRGELEGETHRTKTRGERHQPAARPLGEGAYRIVRHDDHTHLVYALELPRKPGKPQKELEIEQEASYIISIKNPEKGAPPSAGLSGRQKADFPKKLQEKFRGRRFIAADPTDFLNREGTEFVLIGASEEVEPELGLRLHPEKENRHSADIFRDLKIDQSKFPTKPLFEGKWK